MPRTLAERSLWLNASRHKDQNMPWLVIMTDAKRLSDPRDLIPRLPKGSALIVRHYSRELKKEIINNINYLCQKHKVKLLVSDDPQLALKMGLDGVHLSTKCLQRFASCGKFKKPKPHWIITAACHHRRAIHQANKAKVDGVLISPVFKTRSHPGQSTLGLIRANRLALDSIPKAYGLGGMQATTLPRLSGSAFSGIAGISLFT